MWNTTKTLDDDFPGQLQQIFHLSLEDACFASLLLEYETVNDDLYLFEIGAATFAHELVETLRSRRDTVNQRMAIALAQWPR